MTATATKTRTLPWGRYTEAVERQVERHTTPDKIEAAIRAHLLGETTTPRTQPVAVAADEVPPATDRMIDLIDKLLVERAYTDLTPEQIANIKANKPQAHRFIKFLIDLPRVDQAPVLVQPKVEVPVEEPTAPTRARLDFKTIPDGNYAIRVDGVVKFYRVSTSKSGFKNVQVRASDMLYMQYGKAGIAILHQIVEAGLEASQMLFANELGQCWKCGRTLTDETSRARGMGPDCASK